MATRLDPFTRAYIEAALWSTSDDDDEPLDANYDRSDIDAKTMAAIVRDCADFQRRFGSLIEDDDSKAIEKWGRWELAGHDFWLKRNDHGAGFGDGNFPKHDDELYEAAKSYGDFELYVGDGVIYAVGEEPARGAVSEAARRRSSVRAPTSRHPPHHRNPFLRERLAKRFRVGSRVQMSDDALENYGERYRGQVLVVTHVSTSRADHPGFDSDTGSALYDLADESGKPFPNSLYDWELEPAPARRPPRSR